MLETWSTVGMAMAALLLAPAAWAERTCKQDCEADAAQCKAICKQHAGKMAAKCGNACAEEKEACVDDCRSGGSSPEQEPDTRKSRRDDADAQD
jgi:hypothetical protein